MAGASMERSGRRARPDARVGARVARGRVVETTWPAAHGVVGSVAAMLRTRTSASNVVLAVRSLPAME